MQSRYTFLKVLNRGGFGEITLMYDNERQRKVVKKSLLQRTSENCERLIREGRILIEMKDDLFIINLLDYNFSPLDPYLILEYYENGSLENWVGRTNWYDAIATVQNVGAALRSIHSLGGIHRDVKPANCYAQNLAGARLARLGDFGFGRLPAPFTTGDITRHACGTEGYIAPELYSGAEYSPKCDIYSLGITGVELITGSRERNSIRNTWLVNENARTLLLEMTSSNPHKRPNAQELVNRSRGILSSYHEATTNVLTGVGVVALAFLAAKGFSK